MRICETDRPYRSAHSNAVDVVVPHDVYTATGRFMRRRIRDAYRQARRGGCDPCEAREIVFSLLFVGANGQTALNEPILHFVDWKSE